MGRAGDRRAFSSASSTMAMRPGRRQVGHHHRRTLGTPALALAEAGHRSVVGGIARQVVATDPLDGHDRSGDQRPLQKRQYGVGALDHVAVSGGRRAGARRPGTPPAARGTGGPVRVTVSAAQSSHIENPAIVVDRRS